MTNLFRYSRQRYDEEILPICPLVREVVNKDTFPNIPNLPETSSKDKYIARIRILEVFRELIARQQPTREFITWCAHRDNILQDCMNLVGKDLRLLPKRYEKDYPQTSQELKKLINRLYANVSMYQAAHNSHAFMLPPIADESLKDFRDVLAWQEEKENPDQSLVTFLSSGNISETASLICHYPASAINTMNRIFNELFSLETIDIEKAKEEEAKLHQESKPLENDGRGNGGNVVGTQRADVPTGEALALAMLVDHPDWTDTRIALAVGVNRTTLYDWPNFKKAKEALKQGKKELPRGSKNGKTGDMEAWEADT